MCDPRGNRKDWNLDVSGSESIVLPRNKIDGNKIGGIASPVKHYVKNAHTLAAVFALCAWGAAGHPQSPATGVDKTAEPKFEVASIKPADPSMKGFRIETAPGGRYV